MKKPLGLVVLVTLFIQQPHLDSMAKSTREIKVSPKTEIISSLDSLSKIVNKYDSLTIDIDHGIRVLEHQQLQLLIQKSK